MAVLHLGIAAAVDGVWVALMVISAIAVIRIGVIAREERYLEQKFGEKYLSYKATVRCWV